MGKDVIIACDFKDGAETMAFLDRFGDRRPYVKIGMELFYSEGAQLVRELKERGHKIFLDLKLHDIPNTVERAMRVLSAYEIDMCNVHAAGTKKMMEAAKKGLTTDAAGSGLTMDAAGAGSAAAEGHRPLLIAVTQLTSTGQEELKEELLIDRPMEETVAEYSRNAAAAGLDGVVCSALEAPKVHRELGDGFLTITPGIRLAGDAAGDQVRVTTPEDARKLGADYIVVGRSITGAADPLEAYERCREDFLGDDK